MSEYRLSDGAEDEVAEIVARSEADFGEQAADRYTALLIAAFRDLADDPMRLGSADISEVEYGLRAYHTRHSRLSVSDPPGPVRKPRHIIIYQIGDDGIVDVIGLHHDAMPPEIGIGLVLRRL